MRVINRIAISITGTEPYVNWMRQTDAAGERGMLTVARARPFGTACLLPELELEEDVQEWVEDNAAWIFEFQLGAWTDDETTWPQSRDLASFREWCNIEIHNVVVDVAVDHIEGGQP